MKKAWIFGLALLGVTQMGIADAAKISYEEYQEDRIEYVIPQIAGLENESAQEKINQNVKTDMENYLEMAKEMRIPERMDAFDFKAGYEVPYNEYDYVSIVQWVYIYSGGAHGNINYTTLTFDGKTGVKVELKDLFKANVNYNEILTGLVKEEIQSRGTENVYYLDEIEVSDNTLFYMSQTGLVILYPPYEAGPYVTGTVRVHIPWWKLSNETKEGSFF